MAELDQLNNVLKEIIIKYTPPVHLNVLLRGYSIQEGREIPFKEYGYKRAEEFFLEKLPDLELTKSENGLYKVNLRDSGESSNSEDSSSSIISINSKNPSTFSSSPSSASSFSPPPPNSVSALVAARKQTTTMANFIPKSSQYAPANFIRKKAVPGPFKVFLTRIINQYPQGISAPDFVKAFYDTSGSQLSYEIYGYKGHLSMFRDLTDVFIVRQTVDNIVKLYPCAKEGLSFKNPAAQCAAAPLQESNQFRPAIVVGNKFRLDKRCDEPVSNRELQGSSCGGNFVTPPIEGLACRKKTTVTRSNTMMSVSEGNPVAKWTTSQGDLVTVIMNDTVMVPTACLAGLLNLKQDSILEELNKRNIYIKDVKFLSKEVYDHERLRMRIATIGCPMVIRDDGCLIEVISLLPLASCTFVVNAFLPTSPQILKLNSELEKVGRGIMTSFAKSAS